MQLVGRADDPREARAVGERRGRRPGDVLTANVGAMSAVDGRGPSARAAGMAGERNASACLPRAMTPASARAPAAPELGADDLVELARRRFLVGRLAGCRGRRGASRSSRTAARRCAGLETQAAASAAAAAGRPVEQVDARSVAAPQRPRHVADLVESPRACRRRSTGSRREKLPADGRNVALDRRRFWDGIRRSAAVRNSGMCVASKWSPWCTVSAWPVAIGLPTPQVLACAALGRRPGREPARRNAGSRRGSPPDSPSRRALQTVGVDAARPRLADDSVQQAAPGGACRTGGSANAARARLKSGCPKRRSGLAALLNSGKKRSQERRRRASKA